MYAEPADALERYRELVRQRKWLPVTESAARPPSNDGSRDVEVLLETGTMEPGPELDVHLGACAARIRDALDRLPGLKRCAVVKQSGTGLAISYSI
jgi:hypothetical protein